MGQILFLDKPLFEEGLFELTEHWWRTVESMFTLGWVET